VPHPEKTVAGALLSRRTILGAACLAPLLGGCTSQASPSTTADGEGALINGTLSAAATGADHDWAIWYPPGTDASSHLPVAIVLHGMGDTIAMIQSLGYTAKLRQAIKEGTPAYALAAINGENLFWQKLGNQDAGKMVASEFVPLLGQHGLDTSRLGLTGWSMGGWGTLRLACAELNGKLKAIAAISTPCYEKYDYVPQKQWMTKKEFDANNFYTRATKLTNLPIFIACGTEDPFCKGNQEFVEVLAATPGVDTPTSSFTSGEHAAAYWESIAPAQLAFLGQHL
jgi:poly(3-hydroxybutyrate) depolymerase